jgi:hypothetical protein
MVSQMADGDVVGAKTRGQPLAEFFRELFAQRFEDAAVAEDDGRAFVE